MSMINNYLNNFENYLPSDSKREIREELESSILDQIEEQEEQLSRPLNRQEQETLLLKIGHPMKVAAGFLPNQQLVSAEYYPAYKKVLTMALWIYGIITILKMLPFDFNLGNGSFIGTSLAIFWTLIESSTWVFAWVTLAFYLLQNYKVNIDFMYAWSPKQLPNSGRKLPLNRVETAFEILFTSLFLTWWNGLFSSTDNLFKTDFIESITMSDSMFTLLWPVNILAIFSIAISLYNLLYAGWSKYSLVLNIMLGLANLAVIAIMLQFEHYASVESIAEYGAGVQKFIHHFESNIRIILTVIAAIIIWDAYSSFMKLKRR